ncbi:MAG: DUF3291 domain-containing protein [Pseudomonadota bacterium]
MSRELAHVNIATMRWPADDPRMAGFYNNVPAINALAESSPGFVWRLTDAEEEARAATLFGDPRLIIALSVWESIDALEQFVYRSAHGGYLRQRTSWFEPRQGPNKALWWVERGARPTIHDAKHRIEWLALNGPGEFAFGFSKHRAQEAG